MRAYRAAPAPPRIKLAAIRTDIPEILVHQLLERKRSGQPVDTVIHSLAAIPALSELTVNAGAHVPSTLLAANLHRTMMDAGLVQVSAHQLYAPATSFGQCCALLGLHSLCTCNGRAHHVG